MIVDTIKEEDIKSEQLNAIMKFLHDNHEITDMSYLYDEANGHNKPDEEPKVSAFIGVKDNMTDYVQLDIVNITASYIDVAVWVGETFISIHRITTVE